MPVQLTNISAGYDRHAVVHHVSGTFHDASMTAVLGPNGGGKSTLVKALAGFVPLMTGEINFGCVTRQQVAYLPQQFEIDRTFPISVVDVVMLGHWPRVGAFGVRRRHHKAEALKALGDVDMLSFAERPIISLSTGQWQRVLFARLSLQRAKIILLDEPFAAIDVRTTHDLLHVLDHWRQQGSIVICVTHDVQAARDHFQDSLVLSHDLIAWGPTESAARDENLAKATVQAGLWVDHTQTCNVGQEGVA